MKKSFFWENLFFALKIVCLFIPTAFLLYILYSVMQIAGVDMFFFLK